MCDELMVVWFNGELMVIQWLADGCHFLGKQWLVDGCPWLADAWLMVSTW